MGLFRQPRGPNAPSRFLDPAAMREVNRAQTEDRDAHFHGACSGCAWKKGNATGAGLLWCMECAFFDYNAAKPNLQTPMPDIDQTLPEDF